MRISDFEKNNEKDSIENVKQQIYEIQYVLDSKIIPHKNHILFEYDLVQREIRVAVLKPSNTTITWDEAVKQYNSKNVPKLNINDVKTKSKFDVVKNHNCIYVPAMNEENAMKKLRRDFGHLIPWL